ncbi:MAG: hypothetical protein OXK80_05470 [Bdellovibrionales bacterium]|nr:hypothetical protein [Bdellovibrionales bacterium]
MKKFIWFIVLLCSLNGYSFEDSHWGDQCAQCDKSSAGSQLLLDMLLVINSIHKLITDAESELRKCQELASHVKSEALTSMESRSSVFLAQSRACLQEKLAGITKQICAAKKTANLYVKESSALDLQVQTVHSGVEVLEYFHQVYKTWLLDVAEVYKLAENQSSSVNIYQVYADVFELESEAQCNH